MGTGVDNGAPPPGPPWNPRPAEPPHPWPPAAPPATEPRSARSYEPPAERTYDAPPAPAPYPAYDAYAPGPETYTAGHEHDPYAGSYGGTDPAPAAPPPPAHPYGVPQPRTAARPPAPPATPGGRRVRGAARGPLAAGVCLVLGAGLLCGAAAGDLLGGADTPADRAARAFSGARDLWHDQPVDTLFPRTLHGKQAGPGGADRTWTRIGVAPDSGCAGALDPALARALKPVGCVRLLRATYTDATSTDVTTVGVLVTGATPAAMTALRTRLTHSGTAVNPSAVPLPVAFPGTAAAGFGAAQRGSWTVDVATALPVVVYAVSGFADGRALPSPQPASAADVAGATSTAAQAGLGFEADGLADALTGHLLTVADTPHGGGPS